MSVLEDPGSIPGTSTKEGQLRNELALFVEWGRESWDSLPHFIATSTSRRCFFSAHFTYLVITTFRAFVSAALPKVS